MRVYCFAGDRQLRAKRGKASWSRKLIDTCARRIEKRKNNVGKHNRELAMLTKEMGCMKYTRVELLDALAIRQG